MSHKSTSLLIKNSSLAVALKPKSRILKNVSILIKDNLIVKVGTKTTRADKVIEAAGKIVLPGFINVHHHLFQAFLRHIPQAQNQSIDRWIAIIVKYAQKMGPKAHYYAALAGMIELLYSGCTTTADMLYLFPKSYPHKDLFAATIQAAKDVGMRFHPFRGSISRGKKSGGLFPDKVVETSDQIVQRTEAIIRQFHNPASTSMCKVGIGPCTIFTNSARDYHQAALLAKKYKVNLQTHLSESRFEQQFVRKKYHKTPLEYLQDLGWNDNRVSFVHCLEIDRKDIDRLKKHHSSVCHCPISNARQPQGQKGIAPIEELLKAKVNLAIGVDGSAGNDSSNLLEEMRWARTIQGAREQASYLKPLDVLYMATMGGAKALRWQAKLGSITVGKCADLVIFDPQRHISQLGVWDRIGGLISTQAIPADTVIVNGKVVIEKGQLKTLDQAKMLYQAQKVWQQTFN